MPVWLQIIASLCAFTTSLFAVYKLGYRKGLASQGRALDQARLNDLYAPLRRLTMDAYLVTWSSVSYPTWRIRWRRAQLFLKRKEFAKFLKTLRDRGVSGPDTGIEYGKYSREEIEKVIKQNIQLCDAKLLQLVSEALRAQYEYMKYQDPESEIGDVFGVEDVRLLGHIFQQHETLLKRLGLS